MKPHEHKLYKVGETYNKDGDVTAEVFKCSVPGCPHRESRS